MRTEPCACGGIITSSSKEGIGLAVREHQRSLLHRAWRLGVQVREVQEEERMRVEIEKVSEEVVHG